MSTGVDHSASTLTLTTPHGHPLSEALTAVTEAVAVQGCRDDIIAPSCGGNDANPTINSTDRISTVDEMVVAQEP